MSPLEKIGADFLRNWGLQDRLHEPYVRFCTTGTMDVLDFEDWISVHVQGLTDEQKHGLARMFVRTNVQAFKEGWMAKSAVVRESIDL